MTDTITGQGRQRPVGRIRQRRARRKQARQLWQQATTLPELGEVTARWLEGTVSQHPGYYGRPDPETRHLVPVLAQLNRAGYVTENSQPGLTERGHDGRLCQQRAWVSGLCDATTAGRLIDLADSVGLLVVAHEPPPRWLWRQYRTSIPVTVAGEYVSTSVGVRFKRGDLAFLYAWCCDEAIGALQRSWQVTLVDPQWGRDTMWPALAKAVR